MVMLTQDHYNITPGGQTDIYWTLNTGVVILNLISDGDPNPALEIANTLADDYYTWQVPSLVSTLEKDKPSTEIVDGSATDSAGNTIVESDNSEEAPSAAGSLSSVVASTSSISSSSADQTSSTASLESDQPITSSLPLGPNWISITSPTPSSTPTLTLNPGFIVSTPSGNTLLTTISLTSLSTTSITSTPSQSPSPSTSPTTSHTLSLRVKIGIAIGSLSMSLLIILVNLLAIRTNRRKKQSRQPIVTRSQPFEDTHEPTVAEMSAPEL